MNGSLILSLYSRVSLCLQIHPQQGEAVPLRSLREGVLSGANAAGSPRSAQRSACCCCCCDQRRLLVYIADVFLSAAHYSILNFAYWTSHTSACIRAFLTFLILNSFTTRLHTLASSPFTDRITGFIGFKSRPANEPLKLSSRETDGRIPNNFSFNLFLCVHKSI